MKNVHQTAVKYIFPLEIIFPSVFLRNETKLSKTKYICNASRHGRFCSPIKHRGAIEPLKPVGNKKTRNDNCTSIR